MNKIISAVLALAFANSAYAMQNIKLGTVEINPTALVKQSYDSNIYLEKNDVKSSMINRLGLGVDALNKFGSRLELSGGYMIENLSYSRTPSANDAVHHTGNLALKAKLGAEGMLTVNNNFMDTTDQATSELTARAKRIQNTAGAAFESPLRGKFGYGVNVQHTYHNYKDMANNGLDRAELLAGFNINYQLQPKTRVFLAYTYGDLNYQETSQTASDATYNNIDVGVKGNIAPKLVGIVTAGTQLRKYADPKVSNGVTADDDTSLPTFSAQLQWKALEKTEVILYGKRANVESNYQASRFYTSTLGDLSVSREVRKFKVALGGSFESVNYPEATSAGAAKRVDNNTNLRVNVDYSMQPWLKAGFGYAYKIRNSNESANNYKDNVIGLEIKGLF